MKKILLLLLLISQPLQADIYDIQQFNLQQYQGKVIYLDFWASWCKPCQKSFPWMNSLKNKFSPNRFQVVTINLDEDSKAMHAFLKKIPANFDIYHDPSGAIAEKFKLDGMPTSFLLNAAGKVVKKHIGFHTSKQREYEKEIEALL